jgi:hypothetical protein
MFTARSALSLPALSLSNGSKGSPLTSDDLTHRPVDDLTN